MKHGETPQLEDLRLELAHAGEKIKSLFKKESEPQITILVQCKPPAGSERYESSVLVSENPDAEDIANCIAYLNQRNPL